MNSADFLDAVREKHGLTSDYQIHKLLGIPLQTISCYRTRRREFDDQVAMKIADALGESSLYVMASIQVERAKCPEVRKVWEYCVRVGKGAAVTAVLLCAGLSAPGEVGAENGGTRAMYIMLNTLLRSLRRRFRRLAGITLKPLPAIVRCMGSQALDRFVSIGYSATVLLIVVAFVSLAGCASAPGFAPNNLAAQPVVDLDSPHPIKVRTRVRQSKFCAPHHAKHDHYARCKR